MDGYLQLATGDVFRGEWIGETIDTYGEIVFFTGMTGYEEVLTDPSYRGRCVLFTYPLIGNCGINLADIESDTIQVSGVILSSYSEKSYHYEAQETFKNYLERHDVPMLVDVDTRAVVKKLREVGNVAGVMTSNLRHIDQMKRTRFDTLPYIDEVVMSKELTIGEGETHVVIVDFGYKQSLLNSLQKNACQVTVVPYTTTLQQIQTLEPDGILLSNGPGHPQQVLPHFRQIREIAEKYPTLGIGIGHQILALAYGAKLTKLKTGHHGGNYPVIDVETNKVYMTNQSHGYVIKEASLDSTPLTIRYRNINDQSVEGLTHQSLPIFTVQFNPKTIQGLEESNVIYEQFLLKMKNAKGVHIYA